MTTAALLLKGFIIGVSIAMPVGPIGILCIQRTLSRGFASGIATGLGSASADAIYGALAGAGVGALSAFFSGHRPVMRIAGGLIMIALAASIFRSRNIAGTARGASPGGRARDMASALMLTLANPITIMYFAGIIAGMDAIDRSGGCASIAYFIAGVFAGSMTWWTVLSGATHAIRRSFSASVVRALNGIAALAIGSFGCYTMIAGIARSGGGTHLP